MTRRLVPRGDSSPIARHRIAACGVLAVLALQHAPAQSSNETLAAATSELRAGAYDAAIASAQTGLREKPSDPRLRTVEGLAYSLKGDDPHALVALRAALRADPGFSRALKAEAQRLTRAHSPEAPAVLLAILKANREDSTAREMLAIEQARRGQCAPAINNFSRLRSHWMSTQNHFSSMALVSSRLTGSAKRLMSLRAWRKCSLIILRCCTIWPSANSTRAK